MKSTLTLSFIFMSFLLSGQCNIASIPLDITDDQTIGVEFQQDLLKLEKEEYCLEGVMPSNEDFCELADVSMATMWFKIQPSSFANGDLHTTVSTSFGIDPLWAYYIPDGNDFVQIGDCNNLDVTPEVSRFRLEGGGTPVFLRVSIPIERALTASDVVTIKTFVNPYLEEVPCYGGDADGEPTDLLNVDILERNIGDINNPVLFGGEEVVVVLNARISTDGLGSLWLQSIIPQLGDGWDLDYFYQNISNSEVTGGNFNWIGNQDDCAGVFRDDAEGLCVYTDSQGRRLLCNTYTNDCPCEDGVAEGDALPDGYFGITNAGGGNGCSNDCTPSGGFGAGGSTATVALKLDLRVNQDILLDDLTLGVQILADDLSGCWNDQSECRYVTPEFTNPFLKANPTGAYVYSIVEDRVCSNSLFDINIVKNEIRSDSVTLTFLSNDNLSFVSGTQQISTDDNISVQIENTSDEVQVASFVLTGKDADGLEVMSTVNTVQIMPQLRVLNPSYTLCPGSCINIDLETNFDMLTQVEVIWDDGTVGVSRTICEGENETGRVVDLLGCDTVDFEIITFPSNLDAFQMIIPDVLCGNESYFVEIEGEGIDNVQTIEWNIMIGQGGVIFEGGKTIFLDDETLNTLESTIQITATIIDASGCEVELSADREVIILEDQHGSMSQCILDTPTTATFDFPVEINMDYELTDIVALNSLEGVSFSFDGNSTIEVAIDNPMLGDFDYPLIANYAAGCTQKIDLEVIFTDGYNGEISWAATDFEVDFMLTEAEEIQSISWDFGDGNSSDELLPTHIYNASGTYDVMVSMETICGSITREFTVNVVITSIDKEISNSISIFPNPTTSLLYIEGIELNSPNLYIVDNLGRVFTPISNTKGGIITLDLSLYPKGIYFIRLMINEKFITKRVLIQ